MVIVIVKTALHVEVNGCLLVLMVEEEEREGGKEESL